MCPIQSGHVGWAPSSSKSPRKFPHYPSSPTLDTFLFANVFHMKEYLQILDRPVQNPVNPKSCPNHYYMIGSWLHKPYILDHSRKLSNSSSSVSNFVNRSKSRFLCLNFLTFRKRNACPNLFDNGVVRTLIRLVQNTQIKMNRKNVTGQPQCNGI